MNVESLTNTRDLERLPHEVNNQKSSVYNKQMDIENRLNTFVRLNHSVKRKVDSSDESETRLVAKRIDEIEARLEHSD